MAVTHNTAGYTGTVDQIAEARRFGLASGGRFRVASSADWAISASGTTNRTINIAAGMGVACGVVDITSSTDTVAVAANTSGTDRYDAIVATYDWAAMTTTFRVVQGTSVQPAVVTTGSVVDTTKVNWLPGLRYDAALGVVRVRNGVGIIAPADVYDCRLWGPWSNLSVSSASFAQLIDAGDNGRVRDSLGNLWEITVAGGNGWHLPTPDNRAAAVLTNASALTPATGWAQGSDTSFVRATGNKTATMMAAVIRTGAAIVAGSTGNLANTVVATVPTAYRPIHTVGLTPGPGGPLVGGYLNTSGQVVLTATVPNYTIAVNSEITLMCGMYGLP